MTPTSGRRLQWRRPTALMIAFGLVLAACTSEPIGRAPPAGPEPSPSATAAPTAPSLPVVVGEGAHRSYLDGMELAADQVGVSLDVRPPADPLDALRQVLTGGPPAVFVVGSAHAVIDARPEIEAAGIPVILVGGDLYTDRNLFRYAFQTSIPHRWQVRILARYLVVDRGHDSIAVLADAALGAEALAEEGASPAESIDGADAVLALSPVRRVRDGAQLAAVNDAVFNRSMPTGAVLCLPYTWAGWADMIPRVHRFRERFEAAYGHPPVGFEQEGYDAVLAVAEALRRTGGPGGEVLVRELESFRDETYSSVPIRLGPDDHVLAEESQLGVFAVTDRPLPPGEAQGKVPWRPIMRSFTTNGERVNLLDRDKKVFFPSWHRRKPSPNYWKSRFGIVTRSHEDPLH